jgi:hypothetical protein
LSTWNEEEGRKESGDISAEGTVLRIIQLEIDSLFSFEKAVQFLPKPSGQQS